MRCGILGREKSERGAKMSRTFETTIELDSVKYSVSVEWDESRGNRLSDAWEFVIVDESCVTDEEFETLTHCFSHPEAFEGVKGAEAFAVLWDTEDAQEEICKALAKEIDELGIFPSDEAELVRQEGSAMFGGVR